MHDSDECHFSPTTTIVKGKPLSRFMSHTLCVQCVSCDPIRLSYVRMKYVPASHIAVSRVSLSASEFLSENMEQETYSPFFAIHS